MRIALGLGAVAVAVVVFLLLRPDGEEEAETVPATTETEPGTTTPPATTTAPAEPDVILIVFRGGRVPGGVQTYSFAEGDRIWLVVRSDVADHVHIHGFDLFTDVAPGRPATFDFRADLTGSFDIELEDRHVPLAELRVQP
jgi:hypothetical protein